MKALVAALIALSLVPLAAVSVTTSAVSLAPVTSSVSLFLNYSDPASDVVKLWTSNMTPVPLPGGGWTMSPFPTSVNLLWIRSANASANVTLTFEVQGAIADLDNTSYEMRLFTRADNASHFMVSYTNGTTMLNSNATGYTPVDISGNTTITSTSPNPNAPKDRLRINVAKSLLGSIDAWNIDGTATQRGPLYTYEDFGWEVPGNPGSAPTPTPVPSGLPTWAWIAIGLAIVLALVVIVVAAKRRKKEAPPPPE